MKTFGKIVGTIALIVIVACLLVACDSDRDIPGNDSPDIVGDHNPGDEPDTTESPPGDVWEDDSRDDVEEEADVWVWEPGMDPCIPFEEYDDSCFKCEGVPACVQTTFILNDTTCGIQSSCFGLLYGDPNNPPPRFQDLLSYIKILASGDLEAHTEFHNNTIICPPCN